MEVVWKITGTLLFDLLLLAALRLLCLRAKRKSGDFYSLANWHYAHRGLHDRDRKIPENSMAAFRLAVEAGYGAELDVHLTADGKLAVMHDESLLRTAGVDKKLSQCTSEEIECYRLENTQEHIPMLEEVLELFAGKAPLVVELKPYGGNHAELTRLTCQMLDRFDGLTYCIESFDPRVLYWLRKNRPEIIRGQLSDRFKPAQAGLKPLTAWLLSGLYANILTVPHFVAYNYKNRKHPALRLCRKLWGVQEFSWTIRTDADAETALKDHCVIIFEHIKPETRRTSCTIS